MTKFAAALATVAGAALLSVSAVAFVTASQPGTTHGIARLLSAEAVSPSPSQHNGSSQESGGTARSGAAENEQGENEQGEDEACTGNDVDQAEDQQGVDEECTANDANEAEHQQGKDEDGPANQLDVNGQR